MKRLTAIVGAVALVGVLAGCSSSSGGGKSETIDLKADQMAFATTTITMTKNQAYKLVLDNKDSQLHDWQIEKIPAKVKSAHSDNHGHGGGKEPDLHVAADAGKSGSLEFIPTKEGTYEFFCSVAGHKEAGMVGKLIVK